MSGVAVADQQNFGELSGLIDKRHLGGGLEDAFELIDAGQGKLRERHFAAGRIGQGRKA